MPGLAITVIILAPLMASWFLAPGPWARLILLLMRKRAGLSAHSVTIDDIRWHYLSGGRGPKLLLLHGFGGDSHNWLKLACLLRHHFTLLIPDLPGFGLSAPPGGMKFDITAQARRLERFLDTLGIHKCFIVGNSMGGYLATALAARRPQRVAGLWLLAPLGVRSVDPGVILQRIDSGDLDYLRITSIADFRANTIAHMFHEIPWIPGPLVRFLATRASAMQEDAPGMLLETRFESEPLEAIASRVNQPVLVQWGASDQVTNHAGLAVLTGAFPDARGELTPDCGHLPMVECPRQSAELFLHFYQKRFGH